MRLGGIAYQIVFVVLVAGAYSAGFGWRPGAFLMIGAFVLMLITHLAVGILGYRRVMSRPWPRVTPLEDDDDDDW